MVKGFRDMTVDAALKEATRRWGRRAQLRVVGDGTRLVGCLVGVFFQCKGRGPRWRDAFDAALTGEERAKKRGQDLEGLLAQKIGGSNG